MKVSIITVCRNAENTIENTIKSVISQTHPDIEYIIIDGKSEDTTVSVINKYIDKVGFFISEKDSGVYNAMNKGIRAATGDILFFLNANDYLYDENVVKDMVNFFKKSKAEIVFGNIQFLDENGKIKENRDYSTVDKLFLTSECVCHQCIFYKSSVFEKCGLYNENYKIAADYDLNLNAIIKNRLKTCYYERRISKFTLGGFSNSDNTESQRLCHLEIKEVQQKYFAKRHFLGNKVLNKTFRTIARNRILRKITGKLLGFSL